MSSRALSLVFNSGQGGGGGRHRGITGEKKGESNSNLQSFFLKKIKKYVADV